MFYSGLFCVPSEVSSVNVVVDQHNFNMKLVAFIAVCFVLMNDEITAQTTPGTEVSDTQSKFCSFDKKRVEILLLTFLRS